MADDADRTGEMQDFYDEVAAKNAAAAASKFVVGEAGECFYCGEEFKRVVPVTDPDTQQIVKSCGRCRDKRKLG